MDYIRKFTYKVLIISSVIASPAYGEIIDDMRCQKADGFEKRMASQGFKRELTLPYGWGDYDSSTSHNISGSQVSSYDKKSKNRWALFTEPNGQWKLFQGVIRTSLSNGNTESFVCEVKAGRGVVRH